MDDVGCANKTSCPKDSALSYCYFVGAFAAAYAIKDSFAILHTPSGCHKRAQYFWSMHDDLGSLDRQVSTNIVDKDIIFGTEGKLKKMIVDVYERYHPKILFIITSCAPEIIGFDFNLVLNDLKRTLNCRIIPVYAAGFRGNFFDGYCESLSMLCDTIPYVNQSKKEQTNIIGYFFDRYEADNYSNLKEFDRLLSKLNLKINSVFLNGQGYGGLVNAPKAAYNVVFPYGKKCGEKLKTRFNQTNICCDLPIGIPLTCTFIREIGKNTGRIKPAEKLIDDELKYVVPRLQSIIPITAGKTAAVFADPQKIPGLVTHLLDIGIEPSIIGIHQGKTADGSRIKTIIKQFGSHYSPLVSIDPKRDESTKAVTKKDVDFVLGSTVEAWDMSELNVPVIQVSAPLYEEHCIYDTPIVGFEGCLSLSQKIVNTLNKGRNQRKDEKRKLKKLEMNEYFIGN